MQTEQKLLSARQGVSPEMLEQSALKSVTKAIAKRVSFTSDPGISIIPF